MRRIDLLISEARRESDNTTFTDETGLSDAEFLRWANSAQKRLLSKIHKLHPDVLLGETEIDTDAQEEAYDIPAHTFMNTRVQAVWYSPTGNKQDYVRLTKLNSRNRSTSYGTPSGYIQQSQKILIQPAPDAGGGKIRVEYQRQLPRLDIRRGTISAVTLNDVTRQITSLICDSTLDLDKATIESEAFISIVDIDGNIKMEGIPVTSVTEDTGVVAVPSTFSYAVGETVEVGDFVVVGAHSSTNSELSDDCEPYIVDFMIYKAENRDSSARATEVSDELMLMEQEIAESYASPNQDVSGIPIINTEQYN